MDSAAPAERADVVAAAEASPRELPRQTAGQRFARGDRPATRHPSVAAGRNIHGESHSYRNKTYSYKNLRTA